MKSKNRLCIKNLAGALAIPVLVAILLQGICMAKENNDHEYDKL